MFIIENIDLNMFNLLIKFYKIFTFFLISLSKVYILIASDIDITIDSPCVLKD